MLLQLKAYQPDTYNEIPKCPRFAQRFLPCLMREVQTSFRAGEQLDQQAVAARASVAMLRAIEAEGGWMASPALFDLLEGLGALLWPTTHGMDS